MANILPTEKKEAILAALVEGNSLRATSRMTGTHLTTVTNLMLRVGAGCEAMMRERFTGLELESIQLDEIWTFVAKKQATIIRSAERVNPQQGDQWVFVAIDAGTKLVPYWTVGKRDGLNAADTVRELAERINPPFQLTTDAFSGYKTAYPIIVRNGIDYGQQQKSYAATNPSFGRYSPPRVSHCTTEVMAGDPDPEAISTSYVERQNLTMRMHMRRFTRLTNGFSKKVENLRAAVALHFAWYNFVRVHNSLRTTPAVVADVADDEWTVRDLLAWETPY